MISVEKVLFTDVGEGLHEAEILQWFVDVGDTVERDEALVELQTDKVAIEVTAPKKGIIMQRIGDIGQRIIVGDTLVEVDTGEASSTVVEESQQVAAPEQAIESVATTEKKATLDEKGPKRIKAAPSVRKLARELGIDIQTVQASAAHGRITKEDIRNATSGSSAEVSQADPTKEAAKVSVHRVAPIMGEKRREKISGVRKQMYQNIAYSLANIPHTTAMYDMQVDELNRVRKDLKAFTEQPLTYLPFFIKIITYVLQENPIFNASIDEEKEEIIYHENVNIGIAMATKQGLVVPVIHNVETLSLEEIAAQLQDLTERGRNNKLSLHELKGATFTISSTGMRGGVYATPVMTAPQVAILGLHAMVEKPVILPDRTIGIGTVMGSSLSFDHRIIDGEAVGYFMEAFKNYVENPKRLLLKA